MSAKIVSAEFDWTSSSVMITGATGFLGSHLLDEIVARGATVIAVSRRRIESSLPRTTWVQADLSRREEVDRLLRDYRPDTLFHLSSLVDGRQDRSLVHPTIQDELLAAVNVMVAASDVGVRRLVLPGSLEEPDPGAIPASPYAAAKAASTQYARMFNQLFGLSVVHARIFMTYGPGQPDWKLIPSTIRKLLAGQEPTISSPQRAVDWIFVSDVVEGLLRVASMDGIEGRTIDIGSGNLVSIKELVLLLVELCGASVAPTFASESDRRFERVVKANADDAATVLNWRPQVSLREGLEATVRHLQHR